MSSTRKAKDDSIFHQSRYASSQEFERGLLANLVAKRCALIDDATDRELIWFIQYLSHQDGSLAVVAKDLRAKYSDRIQTREMAEMKLKPGTICQAGQVRKLRDAMDGIAEYPLNGEDDRSALDIMLGEEILGFKNSARHPNHYPSDMFFEVCRKKAEEKLERELCDICLNPECKLTDYCPWYFPRLIETLRDYKAEYVKIKSASVVVTSLGEKVYEVLDYTFFSRGLTLMQGEARTGKSFAARAWCEQHPGLARFVEVPPGNDVESFYRALARGLGLGNFLNFKVSQIRARVEAVLRTGTILLVLDEAQRLWPQQNLRYGFPQRIDRVIALANQGATAAESPVPIAMIATPQFTQIQKAVEKFGWNSAQLIGRTLHYEPLPVALSREDLIAVAKSVLPEADSQTLRALASYARSSARYLAAIDSIAKRSRFIAMRAGRQGVTTSAVRKAMQESVIPSDTKLHDALNTNGKSKPAPITPLAASGMPLERDGGDEDETPITHSRATTSALGSRRHTDFEAPLIVA